MKHTFIFAYAGSKSILQTRLRPIVRFLKNKFLRHPENTFLSILMLVCATDCLAQQTNTRNYIISRNYKQSGADPNDVSKVTTNIQYLDGLGRPLQNVLVGQSPSGADFVEPVEFDAAGRLVKKYLPYVAAGNGAYQNNAVSSAASWYTTNSTGLNPADLGRPYHETFFEQSPLSRVSGERAAGNKSANSVIKRKINATNQVNRYDYDPALNTIVQVGQYASGTLIYMNVTDEQGNVTNEFSDLLGQMICRQVISGAGTLTTHYVFDDLGLLRAVLQPNYQDVASLADYAFTYDYDEYGRLIVKRVPGGGTTEIVYDQFDRPVASRDANQLSRGVWSFIKYDAQNRPIVTGEIASNASRATWASNVAAIAEHHEERSNGTTEGYTLNKTAPLNATEANLLTITFYDDYGFSKAGNLAYNSTYYPGNNPNVKGYATGNRARVLPGNGAAGGWLTNVTYYDGEYRPIQTVGELYDLGAGAIERISSQYKYDMAPIVSEQKTEQILAGNVVNTHLATYLYDHADRLLSIKEKVANAAGTEEAFTLAQRYNALGSLSSKWLHSKDNAQYLRRTDYTYNIRGWQTDGKTVYKKNAADPDLPFFDFGLNYANGASYTNGNISQMQWLNKDEAAFTKGLGFNYDGANRLTASFGLLGYADTESGITYDKNGNIKTLIRAGAAVDNLGYAYVGNRLSAVTDGSGSNLGVKSGVSSYAYDGNGNMIADGNRSATSTYNYLNLPKTVTIGGKTFTYDYDAAGSKHKYVADTLTLKYAGAFEYRQVGAANVLNRVRLSEGQAVLRGGKMTFEYYLKDHLSNVRVVFNEKGQVVQRTDFYPFGLSINRDGAAPKVQNWVNRYLYNEKELQVGSGYLDYGARIYMPEVGRMGGSDGAAGLFNNVSPYSYGLNNPLLNIDPSGDTTFNVNDLASNWKQFDTKEDNVSLNEVSVVRPGYQKELDNIYFGDYNKFSPWLPDAYGIQVNASASGIFGEAGFSAGVAMDSYGVAPFVSAGIGVGASPPGIDFSLQFTMSKRANTKIPYSGLDFVNGVDIGNSYGLGIAASESQTSYRNSAFTRDPNGYNTFGFGVGFSFGYKRTYNTTISYPINFSQR
jgi:RHS repeat-associated protein